MFAARDSYKIDEMELHILQLLLFQCMIWYTYTDSALSKQARNFQLGSAIANDLSHQNHRECPMWFNYNPATNDCQCFSFFMLKCDGEHASADPGQMLTYDSSKGLISAIMMRHRYLRGYDLTKAGYIMLPDDISELNQYICGPLNRRNYLCSECKSGYGPAVFITSCTNVCHFCQDTWYEIILYLSLEFVPITAFYLLILVFQIKLTSAPMTCFILYSQLIVLAFYEECAGESTPTLFSRVKFMSTGDLRTETKIFLTFYGVFNLDFFHHVVSPFCISSQLKPIHIVFLGYISAFYPYLLIFLTWLCVELHGHNFRPIVCLWRPFHRCFVGLKRGWNTKSDLIDVFASFFLLSYSKIMYQTVLTFNSAEINNYSIMDGHESEEYALSVDLSIMVKGAKYFFIIIATTLLSFTFIIVPVLLLLLYPTTILFQRLLSKCTSNRFPIILNIFVEKFQCCYKDGLDGASGRRSFSGLHFLLRIMVCFVEYINRVTLKFET